MLRRTTAAPDKAVKFGDGRSAKHPLPKKKVSAVIRNTEQNARNEIKKDCGSSRVLLNVGLNSGIMTGAEIRQSFLDFFREKQHAIVPSSSLMPNAPNLLFTNAGMNQFVPIFLGQQKPPWEPPRVADTQKCIRAGGKHNDLEDVGLDTYHHTFFEMLGNWSFGDYFKEEAIEWAWELVVERWKLPPQRLYATVYKPGPGEPSEFDQEAYDHWERLFREADLDPAIHIVNGNKKDNFWMMGDTGPCGPCSELHVDLTPDGDTRGALVNKDDPRCIEIWNLVFIQFNANADGSFGPLPQRHVDTGLGLERTTAIIQGTKNFTEFSGTVSNYETDIFRPIFVELEELSGKTYKSTLPKHGTAGESDQEKIDIAFRVIADHIRALSFAIADGIIPSNEGRGYVLRRILRRAVRYGRSLGFHEPFFFKLVDVVAKTMGDVFPEVREKQKQIKETIKREEESFNKTLDVGTTLFEEAVTEIEALPVHLRDDGLPAEFRASKASALDPTGSKLLLGSFKRRPDGTIEKTISADVVFKLYDTYGFPLDLTELMARERGLTVDVAGFEKLMEQQRERARKAQKKEKIAVEGEIAARPTKFLGYDFLETEAVVGAVLPGQKSGELAVVLDQTPFYAEMGGQVGDHGLLHVPGHNRTEVGRLRIIDTQKRGEVFVHRANVLDGRAPEPGEAVRVSVDVDRRKLIQGHHTVTHLLHWALHEVVSKDATQKGSYVGPEKLTFDFSSAALTPEQKHAVQKLVNEKIAENAPVSWTEIPYADAKKHSDIQQFFGDKYSDVVRVVQIGGDAKALNGYSMELCGGTHVRATGEIESFRIVREEAIAAGIRRIEAVSGDAARQWAKEEAERQQKKFEMLARKKSDVTGLPVFEGEAETRAMLDEIDVRAAHLEKLEADVREWEKKGAKASEAQLKSRAAAIANELAIAHGADGNVVAEVKDADAKLLQAVGDALKSRIKGPIFLAGVANGRVALLAVVPKEFTSKLQANKFIQEIAPIGGGKGGGRPENAQGAGSDVGKISMALAEAERLITATRL
jgi:alanyl-tRNA synthetase